jgi:hypothetical protein
LSTRDHFDKHLDPLEAARFLGVKTHAMSRMMRQVKLEAVLIDGMWRIHRDQLAPFKRRYRG